MPKISIIIPLYNQKEFVGRAIESALDQSHGDKEVIVVDDGSTDDPQSVLDSFGSDIVVVHQENRGLAGARNSGIKKSQGEVLQFLHSDKVVNYQLKESMEILLVFVFLLDRIEIIVSFILANEAVRLYRHAGHSTHQVRCRSQPTEGVTDTTLPRMQPILRGKFYKFSDQLVHV